MNAVSISRPGSRGTGRTDVPGAECPELMEELRQLRACTSIYRFLLDRLLEKQRA